MEHGRENGRGECVCFARGVGERRVQFVRGGRGWETRDLEPLELL
jgi:hypothetical protein